MNNFKFKIIGKNAEKKSTIYVSVRFGRNEKLMYSTPLSIEPKFWNDETGRVKNTRLCINREGVNSALLEIEKHINDFMYMSAAKGIPITKESLKQELDVYFGKADRDAVDFHSFFEKHIKQCSTRMNNRRGGQHISYKTEREYARTYEYLKNYERQEGIHIEFDDINQNFMDGFVAYLQSLNLATNTIGHKIMCIKAVMRSACGQGYTNNTRYQFIKNQSEESDSVALNEEELQLIEDLDLSKNARLEKTRDVFLVGCWTGLRFSDVGKLRKENIGDDDIITITQSKTNDRVYIPLHPIVKDILERYDYKLPIISNQKFNDYIKEVCQLAGIDKPFIKSITRGGIKQTAVYPKWQVVSSHTARRSFATNLYLAGLPSISIMSVTGHRTETSFLRYIKVSQAEHAKKLLEYWHRK